MAADLVALENLFLGLADKTRLRLLGLMSAGPVSVGHLVAETGDSQPKISRHLAYLRNAGLVDTTRDGKWIYYRLADLTYAPTDSVFRCVVDELSDRSPERPLAKRRRQHAQESAPRSQVIEPTPDENFERTSAEPSEYEDYDSETERAHPSEESHNDLDVFLL